MIKRFRKNIINNSALLVGAALLLTSTAGCGNSTPNVQVLETEAEQPVYLSFFSSQNMTGSDITKYWSDRFTEVCDKPVYINFDGAYYYEETGLSYRELLEKRLSSSAPDDLYIINAEDVLAFEQKGYWMDLSGMDFIDNLSEAALYQSTYNGKVFSIPLSFTGFGFGWNVDLLTEHGLEIPENQEEFLGVCQQLKDAGVLPYGANKGYALTVVAMCAGFSELYGSEQRENLIAQLNSGETPVSTYMRAGYDFIALMIEKGYLDPEQALETVPRVGDIQLFLSGGCAFVCTDLGTLESLDGLTFQTQVTGVPILPEGSVAVYGANSRLCVNPNSNNLDTVFEFIEMVGEPEALEKSAQLDKSLSSAKNAATDGFAMAETLTRLLLQPNQIPNQDFALHFNTWESIRDAAREICGGITVDEACALLDAKQMEELKNYSNK